MKFDNFLPYGYVKKKQCRREQWNSSEQPAIYNEAGKKMKVCYLQDQMCAHVPYTLVWGRYPKEIFWDRFNKGLAIHFYTHDNIYYTLDTCKKKYGILRESEAIVPQDYEKALKETDSIKQLDRLFTCSARLLDRYDNAVFAPANGVWYGTKENGGEMRGDLYKYKCRNISMVCSDKALCEAQKYRIAVARQCMNSQDVDVYGKISGGYLKHKGDALTDYRYSIAIENDRTPYYFTEKILDCFASMTVPIYWGATKIDDFFNADGIIKLKSNDPEEIDKVIKECTQQNYTDRLEAIKDNFRRVHEFLCLEDYISNHYEI